MGNSEFRIMNGKAVWLAGLVMAGFFAWVQPVHAEQAAPKLAELKFDLPKPFFGGTPIDGNFPNLEPEDYRDRTPFLAPAGTSIVSRGKPVTSSAVPLRGNLEQVTDGKKDYEDEYSVELPGGLQWVQMDLQEVCELWAILLWHNHRGKNVYLDVIGLVSNDPEFKTGVTQIYNSDIDNSSGLGVGSDKEYVENNKGRLFDLEGLRARYVRFYSHGNVFSYANHVVELEVWGKKLSTANELPQAPLDIELPEPFFGGTPFDWGHPNLERTDFTERKPPLAPPETHVVSREKPVTSSAAPIVGKLAQVTDGNKNHEDENVVALPEGLQWVQVDLEDEHALYAVLLWHYHHGMRVYFDVIGRISSDPEFKVGVTTIYNNDDDNSAGFGIGTDKLYIDRSPGRLIELNGLTGRYVRFYSNGNTSTNTNHVIEIEVWGMKPDS